MVVVLMRLKLILCIASKTTLNGKAIRSSMTQLGRMKDLPEKYFGGSLPSSKWFYAAMVQFENNEVNTPICPIYLPFTFTFGDATDRSSRL